MLIWHRKANEILDEPDREKQVSMYRALPESIRRDVGELVRREQQANREFRTYGWRVEWQNNKAAR